MQDEFEVDLREIIQVLWRKAIWIVVAALLCGAITYGVSQYMIAPQYTSSVSLYVNNSTQANDLNAVNINDINASQKLVNTYIVILQNDEVLQEVVDQLMEEYTQSSLERILPFTEINGQKVLQTETLRKDVLKMSAVNNTEVLKIEAETRNPVLSARICTLITEVAPDVLSRVVKAGSVEVIGAAKPEHEPSSPNVLLNTAIGFVAGGVIAVLAVLLFHMLDNRVKGEEDLKKHFNIPVLGEIPDFSLALKGGYKEYGR